MSLSTLTQAAATLVSPFANLNTTLCTLLPSDVIISPSNELTELVKKANKIVQEGCTLIFLGNLSLPLAVTAGTLIIIPYVVRKIANQPKSEEASPTERVCETCERVSAVTTQLINTISAIGTGYRYLGILGAGMIGPPSILCAAIPVMSQFNEQADQRAKTNQH